MQASVEDSIEGGEEPRAWWAVHQKIRVLLFLGYPSVRYAFLTVCSEIQTCRLGSISDPLDLCGTAPARGCYSARKLCVSLQLTDGQVQKKQSFYRKTCNPLSRLALAKPLQLEVFITRSLRRGSWDHQLNQDLRGSSEDHQPESQRRERETSP